MMLIWNKTNEFEYGHTLIPPISSDGGNMNQVEHTLLSVVSCSSPSPLLQSSLYNIFAHVLAFSATSPWQPVTLQMQRRVDPSKAATRRGENLLWRQRMTSCSMACQVSCCFIRHAVGRPDVTYYTPPCLLAAFLSVHRISLLLLA